MDVNRNNTGGCRASSAYVVYYLVSGFYENFSGRSFSVEETPISFDELNDYQIITKDCIT